MLSTLTHQRAKGRTRPFFGPLTNSSADCGEFLSWGGNWSSTTGHAPSIEFRRLWNVFHLSSNSSLTQSLHECLNESRPSYAALQRGSDWITTTARKVRRPHVKYLLALRMTE